MTSTLQTRRTPARPMLWVVSGMTFVACLIVALVVLRRMAPALVGLAPDLQMVQVDEAVVPFFDNVFRAEDYASKEFTIKDPLLMRAKPLFPDIWKSGPHDVLGFRNRHVPSVADVIAIGDSQTYGNKVPIEDNWSSVLERQLGDRQAVVYNMSVGGWGAIQYLEIFDKALHFLPRVIVVAFYTGNDPHDSFRHAYANERWARFRPDPSLTRADAPKEIKEGDFEVKFSDGVATTLTPGRRYTSNEDVPAIRAGYEIMAMVAKELATRTKASPIWENPYPVSLLFTIIPTKELVYAEKVRQEGIRTTELYERHVAAEHKHLERLAGQLSAIEGAVYVDLLGPLQQAALAPVDLYPPHRPTNGHPWIPGHDAIAQVLAPAVAALLPPPPEGLISAREDLYYLVRGGKRWLFMDNDLMASNGWDRTNAVWVPARDLANIPHAGLIQTAEPSRFGPDGSPGE